MLVELSKPKTALAVENVVLLATSRAMGYILPTFFVSTMIFVFLGSNPSATKSRAFSYAILPVSSSERSLNRNFSSSVIWKSMSHPKVSCIHLLKIQGIRCPRWVFPEGPLPV